MANLGLTPIDLDAEAQISATQKVRLEQQSLKPGGLVAGAYYRGHLGNTSTIGRWNGQHYRFVVRVQDKSGAKLKSARHVLERESRRNCRVDGHAPTPSLV